MTKCKAPDQLAKRGPKSRIGPKKLAWLHSFHEEWKAAEGRIPRGEFYRRLTQLWFQTFGYELPFDNDPDGDVVRTTLVEKISTEGLSEDDVKNMTRLAKETNTVRFFPISVYIFLFLCSFCL